jgi:hypothetical protein
MPDAVVAPDQSFLHSKVLNYLVERLIKFAPTMIFDQDGLKVLQ